MSRGKHVGQALARCLVYARSEGICERCGMARATEWHHRRNRSQRGLWLASNGMHLCHRCHYALTNTNGRRAEYEAAGWIVRSHLDPATVPVVLARYGRVLIDDEGGIKPAEGEAA